MIRPMKRQFIAITIAIIALVANAATKYAIKIGDVILTDANTTSAETLTSALKKDGVLKSGSVSFTKIRDGLARITLTDAVLTKSMHKGVIRLGYDYNGYDDFTDIYVDINGNCSITNTASYEAAIFSGGSETTDNQRITFTGGGSLTISNASGYAFEGAHRGNVAIYMDGTDGIAPNVTMTGIIALIGGNFTDFTYWFKQGTFKATGTECACRHIEVRMSFQYSRELIDPEGAITQTYTVTDANGNSTKYQSLCIDGTPVKSFTVGAKVYPLYLCGVQIDGDNLHKINDILTQRGSLKSGKISFSESQYLGLHKIYINDANLQYNGTILQNGDHNVVEGTKTPGIDDLEVEFGGENTFTGADNYCGIDNNRAPLKLIFYQGASLTINAGYGIMHNVAMGQDANPTGNYALTITGNNYNYGSEDPARLTINATTHYGIMGNYGRIVYENAVTKINAAKQAISFQDGAGVEPLVFKERPEADTYGFRHGEIFTKEGTLYVTCDPAGNETGSAEIGWIGKTYDIKMLGVALNDYHISNPQALLPNSSFADKIKFYPDVNRLTFDNIGTNNTVESTASTSLPFIENNISELTITCSGQNAINYSGTLLRANAPTKFKAANSGYSLTLNSTAADAVRIGTNASLDVVRGTLIATGKTYGVRGVTMGRPVVCYGTLNMTGGTLKATGGNASIGSLLELNLNQSTIITPTGATWNSAKHAVVDASGNAIAGTTVEIAENLITYALKVGGVDVTNRNCDDILGNGTAVYDPETLTLTLNNANLNANMYNLRSEIEGLTIVLNGENHIKNAVAGTHHGIQLEECDGTTIMGDGTLTIESQGGRAIVYRSSKTVSDVYTTIKDATITTIDNGRYLSAAIYGDNTTAKINLTLDHTNIYMANGTLLLQGLTLNDCYIAKPENAIVGEGCIALETAQWSPYNGEIEILAQTQQETIVGDVDGSGTVDVDDVNAIIYIILGKKAASDYAGNADVDGTGSIDVDDVNKAIAIILNK